MTLDSWKVSAASSQSFSQKVVSILWIWDLPLAILTWSRLEFGPGFSAFQQFGVWNCYDASFPWVSADCVSATGNGGFWEYLWCGATWLPLELVREILDRGGQVPSLINMPIMVFRKVFCPGWQGPTGHSRLSRPLLVPSPWLGLPGHTAVDSFPR